jgi:two-component system, OmpR family, KDP operon response regulator KdpE
VSTKVLVVDDEPPIVRAVAANLRVRGYDVFTAASGDAALAAVEASQPECVVLDLGLPGVPGLEVLRRLRTWTDVPVVVLTAVDAGRDKVTALDLGADDYVAKPFGVAELMARIRVALRHGRAATADRPRVIKADDVAIDLDAKLVTKSGSQVRLTPTEYRLLEVLATNAGRLCTHRFLLERVWGSGGLKSEAGAQETGGHTTPSGSPPVNWGSGGSRSGAVAPRWTKEGPEACGC